MALFGFGKKKEDSAPCCSGCGTSAQPAAAGGCCSCRGTCGETPAAQSAGGSAAGLASVKVLGSGCKSCHALLVSTNEALKAMSVPFEAEYVTDMAAIAAYGVMSTPALVVNEKVVSMGKVYSAAEVEKLLHKLGY